METTVLWDFNGTIVDDVSLNVWVMNRMLERRQLPLIPTIEAYREIFCFPVIEYYKRAGFDFQKEDFSKVALEYMDLYRKKVLTVPFIPKRKGCFPILKHLVTARSSSPLLKKAVYLLSFPTISFRPFFDAVFAKDDCLGEGKGDATALFEEKKGRRFLIGDTLLDAETAVLLDATPLLVASGHQSRRVLEQSGALVFNDLEEIKSQWSKLY